MTSQADNVMIEVRLAELRQLAADTTTAVRKFQRALVEVLRERRLHDVPRKPLPDALRQHRHR
jgi:hypothetical protein